MGDVPKLPPWHRSPHDERLHLIRREVGTVSEAMCEHSVPTALLEEPGENDVRCHECILVWGMELADRRGDPGNYVG